MMSELLVGLIDECSRWKLSELKCRDGGGETRIGGEVDKQRIKQAGRMHWQLSLGVTSTATEPRRQLSLSGWPRQLWRGRDEGGERQRCSGELL